MVPLTRQGRKIGIDIIDITYKIFQNEPASVSMTSVKATLLIKHFMYFDLIIITATCQWNSVYRYKQFRTKQFNQKCCLIKYLLYMYLCIIFLVQSKIE